MKTLIIMDVNTLPSEYKGVGNLKEAINKYEEDFDVKVIPYDTSKKNIEGANSSVPIIVGKLDMSFKNILNNVQNLKKYISSLNNISPESHSEILDKLIKIENKLI